MRAAEAFINHRRLPLLAAVCIAAAISCLGQLIWLSGSAFGQETEWQVIANRAYVFRGRIQRLDIDNAKGAVRRFKVRTHGRRMTFSSLRIVFDDGSVRRVSGRVRLNSGQESKVIEVPANGRRIREIVLIPDRSAPRRNRIRVEVLAVQQDAAATAKATEAAKPGTEQGAAKEAASQDGQAKDKETAPTQPQADESPTRSAAATTGSSAASEKEERAASKPDQTGVQTPDKTRDEITKKAVAEVVTPTRAPPSTGRKSGEQPELPTAKPQRSKPDTAATGIAGTSKAPPAKAAGTSVAALAEPEPEKAPPVIPQGSPTAGGSLLIKTARIDLGVERQSIALDASQAKFGRIALNVRGANVFIEAIRLTFDDGTQSLVRLGVMLFRKTTSRWLQVDEDKFIQALELQVRQADRTRRPKITLNVLGKVRDTWLSPAGEGPGHNEGWLLLAAQSSDYIRRSGGAVPVARNRGGFRELRVRSASRTLRGSGLAIRFADGDTQDLSLKAGKSGQAGSEAAVIEKLAPIESARLSLGRKLLSRLPAGERFEIWAKF